MKASKKPVTVDYYPVEIGNGNELIRFIEENGDIPNHVLQVTYEGIKVKTLEGTSYDLTENDMLIRGVNGEYYPCKKDIFEKTYNKIS